MNLSIQTRHMDLSSSLESHVRNKIGKIKLFSDHIIYAHVILSKARAEHIADATLSIQHHHFHNRTKSNDMYKSIDMLFKKLGDQIKRHKEYISSHKSGGVKELISMLKTTEKKTKVTVADEMISSKPMSEIEALLQITSVKMDYFGFYASSDSAHASFLERIDQSSYYLYTFDKFWQRKNIALDRSKKKIIIHTAESYKMIKDSIETSIEFLQNEKDRSRIFQSIQNGIICLLYKNKKNTYGLLREIE
ncbi:ribosome hibernation-promoting factor, HPF/YfiA family [Spirochaetota bacterium]